MSRSQEKLDIAALSRWVIANPSPSPEDQEIAEELLVPGAAPELILSAVIAHMAKQQEFLLSDPGGRLIQDEISSEWRPGYDRLFQCREIFSCMLEGKKVLDPFAGTGSLVFHLMAMGIDFRAILGDIAYPGGKFIDSRKAVTELQYQPRLNFRRFHKWLRGWQQALDLPLSLQDEPLIVAHNVKDGIPFATDSFDFVVSDPPFGRKLRSGSSLEMLAFLPEMNRVAKQGSLIFVPDDWLVELNKVYGSRMKVLKKIESASSQIKTSLIQIK